MVEGIKKHFMSSQRWGGIIELISDGRANGKLLSSNNLIFVSPGACLYEGYADGTMDIQTGAVTFVEEVAPTIFHLDPILRQHYYGCSMQIVNFIIYFSNVNGNAYLKSFGFGYRTMNPAEGASFDNVEWANSVDVYASSSPHTFDPLDDSPDNPPVILEEGVEYGIQVDIMNAGAGDDSLTIHGIVMRYHLISG